jgi:hypothetical protein
MPLAEQGRPEHTPLTGRPKRVCVASCGEWEKSGATRETGTKRGQGASADQDVPLPLAGSRTPTLLGKPPQSAALAETSESVLFCPRFVPHSNAGDRHSGRLCEALRGRGYRGSYATLARYTRRLRQGQARTGPGRPGSRRPRLAPLVIDRLPRALSPRSVTWLVLRRAEDREAEGAEQLQRLRGSPTAIAEAVGLAEGFLARVRTRAPEQLRALVAQSAGQYAARLAPLRRKVGGGYRGGAGGGEPAVEQRAGGGPDQPP